MYNICNFQNYCSNLKGYKGELKHSFPIKLDNVYTHPQKCLRNFINLQKVRAIHLIERKKKIIMKLYLENKYKTHSNSFNFKLCQTLKSHDSNAGIYIHNIFYSKYVFTKKRKNQNAS